MNGITPTSGFVQSASAIIDRATAGIANDAAVVAQSSAGADISDVASALIDSKQQLLYAQAGAKLISTANQMIGTLIDITA